MRIHSTGTLPTDDEDRPRQLLISSAPNGGWNVSVTVDGRVVEHRHCEDWHRVEQVRREMASKVVSAYPLSAA
jgi:hypothetical protein